MFWPTDMPIFINEKCRGQKTNDNAPEKHYAANNSWQIWKSKTPR